MPRGPHGVFEPAIRKEANADMHSPHNGAGILGGFRRGHRSTIGHRIRKPAGTLRKESRAYSPRERPGRDEDHSLEAGRSSRC